MHYTPGRGVTSGAAERSQSSGEKHDARHAAQAVDAFSCLAHAAGHRHGVRPVGADLGAELDSCHRVQARHPRDRHRVGRRSARRHHRPAADRRDQRPCLVLGRASPPVHHRRRHPRVADDPRPALHRAHLAEVGAGCRDRRRHRRCARARPVDQRQLQPDALAHHRRHARRHRADARLYVDADGVRFVRRARLRDRRRVRQFHADLRGCRARAAVLGVAGVPDRRAAYPARHVGRRSGSGRQQRRRRLPGPHAPDPAVVGFSRI